MALRPASTLRPFTLALIQLGQIGANKSDNLKHARDMVLKAASGQGHTKKPDLVVLPVRLKCGHIFLPQYSHLHG